MVGSLGASAPTAQTGEGLLLEIGNLDNEMKCVDFARTPQQRLGCFTVACLVLNRTIGTGIFAQPTNILAFTGTRGAALTLWFTSGIIVLCTLLCWLELGMTVPYFRYSGKDGGELVKSVPRSGRNKNLPKLLVSLVFEVVFIVVGHIAANAIQAGIFITTTIDPGFQESNACFNKGHILCWALGLVTTFSFNIWTRQFAITLNNLLSVTKILFVAAICLMGIIYAMANRNTNKITRENQNKGSGPDGRPFEDTVLALIFAAFSYAGFHQPCYDLVEVSFVGKTFPKATICTTSIKKKP